MRVILSPSHKIVSFPIFKALSGTFKISKLKEDGVAGLSHKSRTWSIPLVTNSMVKLPGSKMGRITSISNVLSYSPPTLTVNTTGTYSVNVANICNELYDEIFIEFVSPKVVDVDLGPDVELCPGELYQLDATWENGIKYIWQDDFLGANYTVSETNLYEVMITGACGEMGTASIEVIYDETQLSLNIGVNTLLCEEKNDILALDATDLNAETYEWQDGSTSPLFTVTEEGTYAVTITDECNVVTDEILVDYTNCTICEIFIPNGFSPDFNGFNDEFKPFSNCEIRDYSIKIFNRWGALVFESDNIDNGWNGTFNGRPVTEGVYAYWIEYNVNQMDEDLKKRFGGDVTVIR